jgi:hypothetical protein
MEYAISRGKLVSLPDVVKVIKDFGAEEAERLKTLCFAILDYEQEHITLGDPTTEELQQFIRALKELQATVRRTDKILPTSKLGWLVDRIQLSLDGLENPMSEKEANEFLDKHFPG